MKGNNKHFYFTSIFLLIMSAVLLFNGCRFFEDSVTEEEDYESKITAVTFSLSVRNVLFI